MFKAFPSLEKFGVLYGATEALAVTMQYYSRGEYFPEKSLGSPIPHVEIKLVDSTGKTVPVGTCGELLVRSPFILQVTSTGCKFTKNLRVTLKEIGLFPSEIFMVGITLVMWR